MTSPIASIPHAINVPLAPFIDVYARFGVGSYIPNEYTDFFDESMSWKETCYIGDWSPLWKLLVKGPDAIKFFSDISVNSFAKFDVGQGKHAIFCNEDGLLMGEGVLMRLSPDSVLFTSGPGVPWAQYLFEKGDYSATMENITPRQFIFQVQGPNALYVLEKATGQSLRDIGFMRFRTVEIDGMPMEFLRQGMAGEVGFELHGSSDQGLSVYNAILKAGEEFGLRRLGARTQQVNHVEACFPTSSVDYIPAMHGEGERGFLESLRKAGYLPTLKVIANYGSTEIIKNSDLYRSPVQMGWSRNIKFDHEFLGRAALEREVANPKQTMRTLVWNAEDVIDVYASLFRKEEIFTHMELPRHRAGFGVWADNVIFDGKVVGVSTSRCYSYYFREMLSLCTIDLAQAEPGTEVTVLWGRHGGAQKRIRATVAQAPYKQDKRRVDLNTLPTHLTLSPTNASSQSA